MPPRPISEMTKEAIDNEIANYERLKKTDQPRYSELVQARGNVASFEVKRTSEIILTAARQGRYLSYKEVADAYGMDWSEARFPINGHLGDVVSWGASQGMPMLSAIIVNQSNLQSGDMDPATLKGFIAAAVRLGLYDGTEPAQFLKTQQQGLFALAQGRGSD